LNLPGRLACELVESVPQFVIVRGVRAEHHDRAARAGPSDRDQPDGRVKKTEIAGIGGDDLLPRAARADHHMGIDDVRCSACREQPADIGRVHSAEVDNVGCRLPDQARQPGLPVRPPDRLGQRGRRNGDATGENTIRATSRRAPRSTSPPIPGTTGRAQPSVCCRLTSRRTEHGRDRDIPDQRAHA